MRASSSAGDGVCRHKQLYLPDRQKQQHSLGNIECRLEGV